MNTVSFIIPVYNCKAYLLGCIDSIRDAGISHYEILLIDDGSSDGSSELCDELARGDSRIRVIHQKNGGAAAAKNAGDTVSIPIIEAILNEEKQMADWLIQHIPQTTEKFLIRSETDGVEAKK